MLLNPMGLRHGATFLAWLLAVATLAASAAERADASGEGDAPSRWQFGAEVLFLQRGRGNDAVLAEEFEPNFGPPVARISTHSVRHDFESGVRLRIGYRLSADEALRLSYDGIDGWEESIGLPNSNTGIPPNSMSSPGLIGTPNFLTRTDRIVARLSSDIDAVGLDLRRRLRSRRTHVTTGLRYLRFDDAIVIRAEGRGQQRDIFDESRIETRNELFGPQIGLDHAFGKDPLAVRLSGSAGLLLNTNRQSVREVSNGLIGGELANVEGEDTRGTGVLELALSVSYRLYGNVSLVGGYHLLSLHGIALAQQQLDFVSTDANTAVPLIDRSAGTRDGSNLLFHGRHVGLRAHW